MNQYGILNSRKRAIIALIHTIVFGLLACYQLIIRQHPLSLLSASRGRMGGPVALTTIYFIVTVVLLILLRYSRCAIERLYFSVCATSAGIGLLRAVLGDPTAYAELAARVMLLGSAVIIGFIIVRQHTQPVPQFAD
jgi:hypothetical protein